MKNHAKHEISYYFKQNIFFSIILGQISLDSTLWRLNFVDPCYHFDIYTFVSM